MRSSSRTSSSPNEDRIGEEGKGFYYLLHSLNPERIIVAAGAIGIAQDALRRAAAYAKERVVFDRPIGQNQSIQHPLAENWCEIEAAWLMTMKAATLYDRKEPCGSYANAAKLLGGRAAFDAATQAVLTHGGMGYAKEYQVERLFRESVLQRLAPITEQLILSLHRREGTRHAQVLLTMRSPEFARGVPEPACPRSESSRTPPISRASHGSRGDRGRPRLGAAGASGHGKGERSFCSWDEDSITMSVEAVRGCLRGGAGAGRRGQLRLDDAGVLRSAEREPGRCGAGLDGELSTLDVYGFAARRHFGADPGTRVVPRPATRSWSPRTIARANPAACRRCSTARAASPCWPATET